MEQTLTIATYNIHKGFSPFNRRMMLHELKQALDTLHADIVFLQEVQGQHLRHARRLANWPVAPQNEFLANGMIATAYGRNAEYRSGHHGNALLSRHPILEWVNQDISVNRFEQRGLLHAEIAIQGWNHPLHAVCVHLNLLARDRRKQLVQLTERIRAQVPDHAPLIVAGDFNDWRNEASDWFGKELGMHEAHEWHHGKPARSFPARLPLLHLDRIYVRGLHIQHAALLQGPPWDTISDHSPLTARLHLPHAESR